jgi:hypothetical protein
VSEFLAESPAFDFSNQADFDGFPCSGGHDDSVKRDGGEMEVRWRRDGDEMEASHGGDDDGIMAELRRDYSEITASLRRS